MHLDIISAWNILALTIDSAGSNQSQTICLPFIQEYDSDQNYFTFIKVIVIIFIFLIFPNLINASVMLQGPLVVVW